MSRFGKEGYATSSIPTQANNMMKNFQDNIEEHQKTVDLEKHVKINVDECDKPKEVVGLSKVTQDRILRRRMQQEIDRFKN